MIRTRTGWRKGHFIGWENANHLLTKQVWLSSGPLAGRGMQMDYFCGRSWHLINRLAANENVK